MRSHVRCDDHVTHLKQGIIRIWGYFAKTSQAAPASLPEDRALIKASSSTTLHINIRILYPSRTRKIDFEKELGAKYVNFETLPRESDLVTLHVPLSNETYHMIGERELGLMKRTAYLINTSRGSVVDQEALYKALKAGKIAGVALDVFEQEPIDLNDPLLKLDNVVVAPT